MSDIFISYSRADLAAARRLADALESLGWSVFWDQTIPVGKTWREVIGGALEAAGCVVVMWSSQSVKSRYVIEEADHGLKRDVFVPVRIEAVAPPFGFGGIHTADLIDWDGSQTHAGFASLVPSIAGIVGERREVKERIAPVKSGVSVEDRRGSGLARGRIDSPPAWASAAGQDATGAWAEIEYGGVVQRLRWMPPGRFTMGSPENEAGRYDDEGPAHEVSFDKGFWLFDTPCTQALYQAVMKENPSRFQSADRPVENVSWEQAQVLIEGINARIAGLGLHLPSEAQWEYACRAGTHTAIYAGDFKIAGENNAPALDPIAWYGGNSGVDFELKEGVASSSWPEKQYAHKRAGTHPVGLRLPNAWGLYDMLGNVWEWVADAWHETYAAAPTDGSVWEGGGALRVIRGGSWGSRARLVRCASRAHDARVYRSGPLGFRCARVQA